MQEQLSFQSKKFKDYHAELRSVLTQQQLSTFSILQSNRERILFIANLEVCPMFPISIEKFHGKNLEVAKKLKNEGNTQFQKENYKEAFTYYSKAILKTSPNLSEFSEILSVNYANRSAALYHLQEYNFAIEDIDFAFENKYPPNLSYKLLDRKARCLLALKRYNMAYDIFKNTITALDIAKLPTERKRKWQKDIQILLLTIKKDDEKETSVKSLHVEKTNNNGKEIKYDTKYEAITSAVAIKFSDEMGRYAEAKIDIKVGEMLLVEEPHCAVLLETYKNTHCYHCFIRVKVLYPCPTCDEIIFCSKECAQNATSSYHQIECSILRTLWATKLSVTSLMALRIISQKNVEYFHKKKHILNHLQWNEMKNYNSRDYEPVYFLVNHETRRKPEDLMNRIHVALFFIQCLKQTSYFNNKLINVENKRISKLLESNDELYITELLLRHLEILQFNAHEVSEFQIQNEEVENGVSKFIGGALYPTLALFNHSCNPGVIRYFKGTKVFVRAIRTIFTGQMIPENYGPIFTEMKKKKRQCILREQYWFSCKCEACINNWPTFSEIIRTENFRFRCSNKKCNSLIEICQTSNEFIIKCGVCSSNINILKMLKTLEKTDSDFQKAKYLMEINQIQHAIPIFLRLLQLLEEILVPPFKDYYVCQEKLRTCFLMMGNYIMTKTD